MKLENKTNNSCPYCGASAWYRAGDRTKNYDCGSSSLSSTPSELCKTRRERDDWAEKWAELSRSALNDVVRLERELNIEKEIAQKACLEIERLRDIAERAVKNIREARNLSVIGDWREIDIIQERLRAELDKLKEGAK